MNEYLLLDLAADLGYHMAVSGAETYRVEDTVRRILEAYGLQPEVAAVPVWVTEPEEVAPVLIRELEEEAEVLDISNLQPINSHHYRPYP